jgi:hypothetical protein
VVVPDRGEGAKFTVGLEADCTATFGGRKSKGRAYLETDSLIFRGAFRVAIPFTSITRAQVRDGRLTLQFSGGTATFALGSHAQTWVEKILHPKSLLDKVGVKPGDKVAVVGIEDADFLDQLRERTAVDRRVTTDHTVIFVQADRRSVLSRLNLLRRALAPAGALWVVSPKGVEQITEADVLAAGRKARLVDVKVVRFSETHTAHKFVIPKPR